MSLSSLFYVFLFLYPSEEIFVLHILGSSAAIIIVVLSVGIQLVSTGVVGNELDRQIFELSQLVH